MQSNIVSVGYRKSVTFPANGGTYRLTNLASGKVLDAVTRGTANGTRLDLWQHRQRHQGADVDVAQQHLPALVDRVIRQTTSSGTAGSPFLAIDVA